MTLRLRLTLLYGACFLAAGAVLLAITYGLVSNDNVYKQREFVGGARISFPGPVLQSGNVAVQVPTPLLLARARESAALPKFPPSVLTQLTRSGQAQINRVVRRANVALQVQRDQSLNTLLTRSGLALGIMALVSIGLGWLVAGRALRPLRVMSTRAREITAESLHERLGLNGRRDELGQLAATFDGLLGRLEQAFEAQKRFVANASHELRTPVTLERAVLEVALADPGASIGSLRHACERVLATNAQQERLIEGLLTLARGQAAAASPEPTDLGQIAVELTTLREHETPHISWETDLQPAVVSGDPVLLERLIGNLIDNAVAYNLPEDGWIRVETGTVDGRPRLRIANTGQIVGSTQVDELFEPFRRAQGERPASAPGTGLGLSIVRAIADASGATVAASPHAGGGLELAVEFPPAPVPPASVALATLPLPVQVS
jgi:signal transduction histidine kinase